MTRLHVTLTVLLLSFGTSTGYSSEAGKQSSQIRDRSAKVKARYVDVLSGPASAYTRRGRLYRGDVISIRGEPGATWVHVLDGAVKGWVPLSKLTIIPYATVRKSQDDEVDAGRDRRESNYAYDQDGRRRTTDGKLMGSGEGIGQEPPPPSLNLGPRKFSIDLSVGFGQTDRRFYSNSALDSVLYGSMVAPIGLATQASAQWAITPWLSLESAITDVRLGASRVTAAPLNNGAEIEIDIDSQTALVDVLLTYPIGDFTVGGFGGVSFFRTGFTETEPVPLFLNTVVWSAVIGGSARYTKGDLDLRVRGAYVAPFSIQQAPNNSGTADGSGHHINGRIRWWAWGDWALAGELNVTHILVNYAGGGDHVDTVALGGPYTYSQARESTQVWGVVFGFTRRL